MRHDHFVPQFTQYPAYPGRVRPRFQRHPTAGHPTEDFLHGLRRGRHFLFQNHFSRFIQNAVPTPSISQIKPNRQFLTCNFFDLLCRCSANLLHCRSPLSPCALSASITWELIASRRRPAFSSHLWLLKKYGVYLRVLGVRLPSRPPCSSTRLSDYAVQGRYL